MKKTEKLPDGTERETHIEDGVSGFEGLEIGELGHPAVEFRGEAPPDRSRPVNDEVVGTVGAIIPPPSPLPKEEGHPPEIRD